MKTGNSYFGTPQSIIFTAHALLLLLLLKRCHATICNQMTLALQSIYLR